MVKHNRQLPDECKAAPYLFYSAGQWAAALCPRQRSGNSVHERRRTPDAGSEANGWQLPEANKHACAVQIKLWAGARTSALHSKADSHQLALVGVKGFGMTGTSQESILIHTSSPFGALHAVWPRLFSCSGRSYGTSS